MTTFRTTEQLLMGSEMDRAMETFKNQLEYEAQKVLKQIMIDQIDCMLRNILNNEISSIKSMLQSSMLELISNNFSEHEITRMLERNFEKVILNKIDSLLSNYELVFRSKHRCCDDDNC